MGSKIDWHHFHQKDCSGVGFRACAGDAMNEVSVVVVMYLMHAPI